MKLNVYEVVQKANSARYKADKIRILQENESWALKDVLRGTFDSTVKWLLPPGEPPFKPNDGHNAPSNLLKRNTEFRYFVKGGGHEKMPSFKRESMFVRLIESIHPDDARLVIAMINKEKPKNITRNIVEEAFPGLLLDQP